MRAGSGAPLHSHDCDEDVTIVDGQGAGVSGPVPPGEDPDLVHGAHLRRQHGPRLADLVVRAQPRAVDEHAQFRPGVPPAQD
ncbi:hypothetical protein [Streptomyces gossypiisoli]|uniref:hypothetical protein n=1 Tax=Streptomyces gossypiisoli TaxID=2748864 RepID=UPI0015DB4D98|nr:hypothetical protein [Streptomyces gossypiisoli]